ncbi:ABC transporter permease [Tunicatimonas pelagia]|uniref:ABC transporter permease n=1 Tax=Tunicatimonas pelagia TaxID=931531 RepID=UPI002665D134|nr:ABC transporter permease [Tunicatimonas pelagia]WKN42168.1 ABC transporter permease [Tunicatimonas pelagia]
MFRNYLKTALRHLLKNRVTTSVNVLGLALGISCVLIILTIVRYERSYDQFHSDADRIYRVVRVSGGDGPTEYRAGISYPVPDALKEDMTIAKGVTATFHIGDMQVSIIDGTTDEVQRQFQEDDGITFADANFFRVFDFKDVGFRWIAGNPETALKEPFTAVLNQTLANKYFPEGNALGNTLKLDNLIDVKVTGVVTDLPANSDFPFKIMVSYATLNTEGLFKNSFSDWYSVSDEHYGYVLLNEGITVAEAEAQILEIHAARVDEKLAKTRLYKLQPLREVHTDARFGNYRSRTVSSEIIWALLIIGLFVIGTASINFVNLSTAQSVLRSKEVGIRKTMGGNRAQLTFQFLGETFIVTLTAGVLALGAAELVTVSASDLLQVETTELLLSDSFVLISLIAIIVGVALLAGIYPALMMSRFNPVAALKNKIGGRTQRGIQLRRGLVTLQFVIAQVFIISTIIVIKQMDYFRNAELGFDKEAVITAHLPEGKNPELSTLETLENQWKNNPAVASVSFASSSPSGFRRSTSHWDIKRKSAAEGSEGTVFERQSIDEQYLELFQIPLLAGRNFLPSDTSKQVILNRKLSERMGFSEPVEALNETVLTGGENAYTVIGVVENFHTGSLKGDINYLGFMMRPRDYNTVNIKLNLASAKDASTSLSETIQQLEATWAATYPEYIFDYRFLDESIAAYYQEEARLTQLFKILAGITIFIGCLGLYGLISFMAVRRTKEVGIRKVLGASISSILVLFSKEFIVLVGIAFMLAAPIAYYLMQQWLMNFTYQIDIGASTFVVAIGFSALVALLTVSYQSVKAALANPVDSLRNE